jgi:hypothetical protein
MGALRNHYKGSKAFKRGYKKGNISRCGGVHGTLCTSADQSELDAYAEVALATSPAAYNAANPR